MSKVILRGTAKVSSMAWSMLDRFYVYPYYFMNELPSFRGLKEEFRGRGVDLVYLGPPLTKKPLQEAVKYLEATRARPCSKTVLFSYVDTLDAVAHKYGVNSEPWAKALAYVDGQVELLWNSINATSEHWALAVFADHGILNVKNTIDLIGRMRSYRLDARSVTIFVDATLSMIWLEKKSALRDVLAATESLGMDRVVVLEKTRDQERLRKYGVFLEDGSYGDVIIQAKPGFMFFPNFYSDLWPFRAVHGFLPEEECQRAFIALVASSDIDSNSLPCKLSHIKDVRRVLDSLASLEASIQRKNRNKT
jgi:hypothetical protein